MWLVSASRVKSGHFRGLAPYLFVSPAEKSKNSTLAGELLARVSGREFQYLGFVARDSVRRRRDRFDTMKVSADVDELEKFLRDTETADGT